MGNKTGVPATDPSQRQNTESVSIVTNEWAIFHSILKLEKTSEFILRAGQK
jgi:hypothetical protein